VGVVHFLNELPHSLSWRGPAAVAPRLLTELSTDCVGNCDGDRPSPRSHPGRVLLRRRSMLIVGAPPPVRRVKPEHRAGRCSHPGRVLLQEKLMLIVGAPPPVRRVKPEHRTSRYSHPGRVLLQERRMLCRSTALGAKGEAR